MAGYWLKLYTEILDDPKYFRLSDNAKLGMIELMIVAKRVDLDGEIPSIEDVAFYTRRSIDWWIPVFEELSKIQYLVTNGGETIIRKFAERQAAVSDSERQKQYRAVTHKKQNCNEYVTKSNGDTDTDTDTEKNRLELEAEEPPSASPNDTIDCTDVYTQVTQSVGIPGSQLSIVLDSINSIKKKYSKRQELIDYLKPFYLEWISRQRKDGSFYSKANCTWLTDWAVSGEIPKAVGEIKSKTQTIADRNSEILRNAIERDEARNGNS